MILVRSFPLPAVNRCEILRYAGAKEESPELRMLLDEVLAEALPLVTGKVCWITVPLSRQENLLNLGFAKIRSDSLCRNLSGCTQVVVFAATIGLGIDRLIARYGRISPSKALLFQAVGAERIESLCDVFCEFIANQWESSGLYPAPRFSPGYGDFPLDIQRDLFQTLDCARKIGLTLNESLLMSPSKSVTAFVGLRPHPCSHSGSGCSCCSKTDCIYRRMP